MAQVHLEQKMELRKKSTYTETVSQGIKYLPTQAWPELSIALGLPKPSWLTCEVVVWPRFCFIIAKRGYHFTLVLEILMA